MQSRPAIDRRSSHAIKVVFPPITRHGALTCWKAPPEFRQDTTTLQREGPAVRIPSRKLPSLFF